eukprot:10123589-Heterocapsa_arctica.AAC.1
MVQKHHLQKKRRLAVITNQCPWCARVFRDVQQTKQHAALLDRGIPCTARTSKYARQQPVDIHCPFCGSDQASLP